MNIVKIIMSMFLLCTTSMLFCMEGAGWDRFDLPTDSKAMEDFNSFVFGEFERPVRKKKPIAHVQEEQHQKKSSLVVIIGGISSSGKSTIVQRLKNEHNVPVVAFDDYIRGNEDQGLKEVVKQVKEIIKEKPYVVCDIPIEDKRFYEKVRNRFRTLPIKFIWVESSLEDIVAQVDKRNLSRDTSEHRLLSSPIDQYLRTHKPVDVERGEKITGQLSFKFVYDLLNDRLRRREELETRRRQERQYPMAFVEREFDLILNAYYEKFFEKNKQADERKEDFIQRMIRDDSKVSVGIVFDPAPDKIIFNKYYADQDASGVRKIGYNVQQIFDFLERKDRPISGQSTPRAGMLAEELPAPAASAAPAAPGWLPN